MNKESSLKIRLFTRSGIKYTPKGLRASWNRCEDSGIIRRFGIDYPVIFRGGAVLLAGTLLDFPTGKWVAPFVTVFIAAEPPVDPVMVTNADRDAIFVNGNGSGIS